MNKIMKIKHWSRPASIAFSLLFIAIMCFTLLPSPVQIPFGGAGVAGATTETTFYPSVYGTVYQTYSSGAGVAIATICAAAGSGHGEGGAWNMVLNADTTGRTNLYNQLYRAVASWYAWFPADYLNGGSLQFELSWTTDDADLGTVEFEIYAKAIGDGDSWATSWGSGITLTDTSHGANLNNDIPLSSGLVASNSPIRGDKLLLKIVGDESESTVNTNVYLVISPFRYPRAQ